MAGRLLLLFVLAGCSSWVAAADAPPSTTSFAEALPSPRHLDKVDLLFAIDDSPSMSDKQQLLAQALPDFVRRLIMPACVAYDGSTCAAAADCVSFGAGAQCDASSGVGSCVLTATGGACPAGMRPEIEPIADLHVAIVSSSLGGGGSPDACTSPLEDGHGQLAGSLPTTKPRDGVGGGFLAWFPRVPENAGKPFPNVTGYGNAARLLEDFGSLVGDVGASGCGLEAQLESWYRFLIQPDPFAAIVLDASDPSAPPVAKLVGVDGTLLKMRHDFLRFDSLVVVVQVTDEDDSWSDPLWDGGRGWMVRAQSFPGGPGLGVGPRGTSECDNDPNDPDCTSCAFAGRDKPVSGTPIAQDPNCTSCAGGLTTCPQKGWYTPQQDGLGVRYTSAMRRRYGLDPQWSAQRYVDGLRLAHVPDRDHEVHDAASWAAVQRNCTNPLFARVLPDGSDTSPSAICALAQGPRTPDRVLYALIGGAPPSLLHDAGGRFKRNLGPGDWAALLGDPHMIEATAPRPGLELPGATYSLGSDPDHGREYDASSGALADVPAANVGLQLACTFQLPSPRDCTQAAGACDCAPGSPGATAPDGPPLCDPIARTTQVRGKAYPSVRELRVAQGLGGQAVVASICAQDTAPSDAARLDYGYADAMRGIIDRLKCDDDCGPTCLALPVRPTASCEAPCVVLAVYPGQTDQAAGCTDPGMSQPDDLTLHAMQRAWFASTQAPWPLPPPPPVVCVYEQLVGGSASSVALATGCMASAPSYQGRSCDLDVAGPPGWCLVMGQASSGDCPYSIRYGGDGPPWGASLVLECSQSP